jgi:glycosyltransferase involved in cell wall biosynthesis
MRIGIDARLWKEKGLGRYIRNIVSELLSLTLDDRLVIFCLEEDLSEIKKITADKCEIVIANVRWYSMQEQFVMPILFVRAKLDVLHVPHFNAPVFYPGKIVITLHDLTHLHSRDLSASKYPAWVYAIKHAFFVAVLRINIRRSKKVIVVSEYVQNDLQKSLNVLSSKTKVIYEAAKECQRVSSTDVSRVLSDYGVTKKYFYYIGNAYPHKNLEMLLEAFAEFRKKYAESQLVLSGGDSFFWPRLKKYAIYRHLSENVIFTGKVSDRDKDVLMSSATAYIFPSLSEGFGLPILEAMSCGCPVLATNRTALPEIGGDACLYFEPRLDVMLQKMLVVWEDVALRKELIRKGHARIAAFSWNNAAIETLKVYRAIAG